MTVRLDKLWKERNARPGATSVRQGITGPRGTWLITFAKGAYWLEQLDHWKQNREIFSIKDQGLELFPIYEFDADGDHCPCAAVGQVLRIFGDRLSELGIASWFEGLNSFFDDQCPKDLLLVDPRWVIEAAYGLATEPN